MRIIFWEFVTRFFYWTNRYFEYLLVRAVDKYIRVSPDDKYHQGKSQELINLLDAGQISEPKVRSYPEQNFTLPVSFKTALVNRSYQKSVSIPAEWVINDKLVAAEFAKNLSLKRPVMLQGPVSYDKIQIKPGIVIKPLYGSGTKAVYFLKEDLRIIEAASNETLQSVEEMYERLENYTAITGYDDWLVEEYVNGESKEHIRDLKFYCFYGKTGIIHEVKRLPVARHCWWDASGNEIITGKLKNRRFKGDGFSDEDLALAEKVSLEIPAPFIRIDFLKGKDGLYFGEFTPRPGGYHTFNKQTDLLMGHLYLEAEARLTSDLLNGKSFDAYKQLTSVRRAFNDIGN
jgi:hypothetical protein